MHRKALLLPLIVSLLGFGGWAGASSAGTGDTAEPAQPEVEAGADPLVAAEVVSPEVAWLTDASAVALEQGISIDEAMARFRFEDAVDQFVASLPSDLLDEVYLGGELIGAVRSQAVLRFKGEVPEEIAVALQESGLHGVTLQGGMAHSYLELQRFTQAAHRATVGLGFTSMTSSFSVRTGVVEISVVLQASKPQLRGAHLMEAILAATDVPSAPGWVLPEVIIREFPADSPPLVELAHTYGGGGMRDDGVFECTSAFTVVSGGGTPGVLTASHCEGINQMDENNSSGGVVATYSAPFVQETLPAGTYGDIEWHTTTHTEYGQFWALKTQKRSVLAWKANSAYMFGNTVCIYGRTTNQTIADCGSLSENLSISTTFFWNGQVVTTHDLAEAVAIDPTLGGDSGGPFYRTNTAWGITQGNYIPNNTVVFSKIQNAMFAFNVSVILGG